MPENTYLLMHGFMLGSQKILKTKFYQDHYKLKIFLNKRKMNECYSLTLLLLVTIID